MIDDPDQNVGIVQPCFQVGNRSGWGKLKLHISRLVMDEHIDAWTLYHNSFLPKLPLSTWSVVKLL